MSFWSFLPEMAGKLFPALGSSPAPMADISTAGGAALRVIQEIIARKINLSDAEALANGIQQILVDVGSEPQLVFEASKLAEAVAAALASAYSSGIVTGGVPAAFPPGGGPGAYRGR